MLRGSLIGKHSGKQINARILLDSGAEGLIINEAFVKRNSLTLQKLIHTFPAVNVDGSPNSHGLIQYTTIQRLRLLGQESNYHQEEAEFYVTNIGDTDIILGTDWLKHHNPEVDWAHDSLTFTRCPATCTQTRDKVTLCATACER